MASRISGQPPTRGEQLVLVIFTCAAVAAFGAAFNQPAAWIFCFPAVVSPFWRFKRLPNGLVKWTRYTVWPLLALTVTLGFVLMAYPSLFSDQTTKWLTLISGYGLASFAAVSLLGTPLWSPGETAIPAATGLAVVACFNSMAVITPLLATPGAAAFVYLLISKRPHAGQPFEISDFKSEISPKRARLLRLVSMRLALSALASALLAGILWLSLPRLQQKVETATMRWLSSETQNANPFGVQSQLGDLQRLQLSRRVVLRVWTARPQKLRARVFGRFDGRTWQAIVTAGTALPVAPPGSYAAWLDDVPGNVFLFPQVEARARAEAPVTSNSQAPLRRAEARARAEAPITSNSQAPLRRAEAHLSSARTPTRIIQSVASPGVLATPVNKLLVRLPLPNLRVDPFDNLIPALTSQVPIYGVVNLPDAQDSKVGLHDEGKDFLAVPPDLDPRWPGLAKQLAANAPSVEERVSRTINYVKHAAKYSLEVGDFRSRQPITEFFFEKKRGYCQYFATAAALLLRLEGISARYVTGYNVQEFNQPGGYFVVRDADAHAWVEVLIEGKGWVEADPTPEAEFEARREAASSGRLAAYSEWMAALVTETWVLLREGDWRDALMSLWRAVKTIFCLGLLATVFLLGLVAALRWVRQRRRRSVYVIRRGPPTEASDVRAQLERLRETLDRCWEKAGFRRPPFRGLLEHLDYILSERGEFLELSRRLANHYYLLSFGGRKLSADDLRDLDRLSAQLASEAERQDAHSRHPTAHSRP